MKYALSGTLLLGAMLSFLSGTAGGAEVSIAVASNFSAPLKRIVADFERDTGHRVVTSFGSTGALYAQIRNGAPFDAFLAADARTPSRMVVEKLAVDGSQFTYALGKLVLWSARTDLVDPHGTVLWHRNFERIAIANPKLAPYGTAAIETMRALDVLEKLRPRLVTGENIAQTYQFVATQNAQLGFIALSQVMRAGKISAGSAWIVDPRLYSPIKQDAVLLERGRGKAGPLALMKYLRGSSAQALIRAHGYDF